MNKRSIVAVGLLLVLTQGCQPSASQRIESAVGEVRTAVVRYGRAGTVEQKEKAAEILHARVKKAIAGSAKQARKGSMRKKSGPVLHSMAPLVFRLSQVRKGSPDPKLAGGPLTDEERSTLEIVNEPLTEADVRDVEESVREDLSSADKTRRLAVVGRLRTVGEAALPSLARLMCDADIQVATTAAVSFIETADGVSDSRERAACAKAGLLATTDATLLEKLGMVLVTSEQNAPAVEAIVFVVENGTPEQAAAAKEAYSSITGDDWTDRATAEEWMRENSDFEDDAAVSADEIKSQSKSFKKKSVQRKKRERGK